MRRLLLLHFLLMCQLLLADAHIFVLHRFDDARHLSTSTSTKTLTRYFDYLKTNGYEVVSMAKLADALHHKQPIPDNWVLFTIDDSYKSFYTHGLPLFKAYKYPFTLFVYVQASQERYGDFMRFEQIKEAMQYGEIGLHSYGHNHLVSMTPEAVARDTKKGLQILQHVVGAPIRYYAYPYGEYDRYVKKEIQTFGFELICNQNSGAVSEHSDPFDLDRTALTGDSKLAPKLKQRYLPVEWLLPKGWPLNGKLKLIHAKISPEIASVEYYISGGSWKRTNVHDGIVRIKPNIQLEKKRTRLFLKHGAQLSSMIIVKE